MQSTILLFQLIAVDTDITVHARESAAWAQYAVDILWVDAMHEAIAVVSAW